MHPSFLSHDTGSRQTRRFAPPSPAPRVVGYASARTEELGRHTDVLHVQAARIDAACRRRGLFLVEVVHEVERGNGRSRERPALDYGLERIAAGEAAGVVVCALGRLSRSVVDLGTLMAWLEGVGARLIALDLGMDTSTPAGRLAARTLRAAAELEQQRIHERTRSGLAAARRKGGPSGRPAIADRPELRERIAAMRSRGMTLQAIADQLNAEGVPTARGGSLWRPSSVHSAAGYRRQPRRTASHLPSPRPPAGPADEEER